MKRSNRTISKFPSSSKILLSSLCQVAGQHSYPLIDVYSMCACVHSHFSHVQLFAILWATTLQVPLSMGFSRQEYWRGLLCPPPGDLPNPGIEPTSPALSLEGCKSPGKSLQVTVILKFANVVKTWAMGFGLDFNTSSPSMMPNTD